MSLIIYDCRVCTVFWYKQRPINKDTTAVNLLACTSQASGASDVGRIFGNLTNCTIGNNINPTATVQHSLAVEEEFDDKVKYLDVAQF